MTTREEALRLADALDGYAHGDEFQRVTEQAAELLRQWPETHAAYPVRCPETGLICSTCPTLRIPCEAAAPSQQPAPARPDEFVCPYCFDEGAAPQAAQSGMVPADCEHKRALWNITFTSGVCRDCDSKWTASGGWVAAAPQAVLLPQPQPQPLTDEQIWEFERQSWVPHMATVFVEETDTRPAHYTKESRPFFSLHKFTRLVQEHCGITAKGEQ